MLGVLKRIWRGWKRFAHGLVKGQSWLLMAIGYFLAITPVALFFKVFRPDPLDQAQANPGLPSYGKPVRGEPQDIRRAQRPW